MAGCQSLPSVPPPAIPHGYLWCHWFQSLQCYQLLGTERETQLRQQMYRCISVLWSQQPLRAGHLDGTFRILLGNQIFLAQK